MKKKIVSMLLAATVMTSLVACGSKESGTADSNEKKVLTMATNAEFPPYEYRDGNDIVGIDVDIAKAIADDLGMELKVNSIEFDSIIPAVNSGKADIGVAGMTVTPDRKENVEFTDSYTTSTQIMIVKEDNTDITKPEDLKGKKVGVQTGTTGDLYVSDKEKGIEVSRFSKGMEAVQSLTQGKVDAVVIDSEPAKEFVKQNTGIKILDESYTNEDYAIAVKKGNTELTEKINASLKKLKESGELQKIIDKYIK
ncbi:MAG: basic amino acid ABC transporter substrate-binding protein [bacterium]|nr:basic amino acid ABC transporter substrate-binding protein [bacterium]